MPEHGRDGELISAKYPRATKERLMRFLEHRHFCHLNRKGRRSLSAWMLARALKLRPDQCREGRRRRVRELVKEMRAEGAPIASVGGGYHLATEVEDFDRTERFLRGMGLGQLATAAQIRRSPARDAAAGQLSLTAPLAHRGLPGATAFYRPHDPEPTRSEDTPPEIPVTLFG